MKVKVFFCEPIGEAAVTEGYRCDGCGARSSLDVGRFPTDARPPFPDGKVIACGACGGKAVASSQGWSEFYRRTDTGEEVGGGSKMPVGAVWEYGYRKGPDGRSLSVVTPGGSWCLDGRASNCTMPQDDAHYCWIRHGKPEDGSLHVDKDGLTCGAGAGSIMVGGYHGFLHHGHLEDC